MKTFFRTFLILVFFAGVGFILFNYWPYIFAKNVSGVISDVQRVSPPTIVVGAGGSSATSTEMFSFAVAIKQKDGEIATASSEDRQWAVARPGQCVEAKFFPYPPWQFEKSGAYYGARLIRLYVCDEGKLIVPEQQPAAPSSGN